MKWYKSFLIPVILFVLAFVVRIIFVSSSQIANDEPFTIFYSQQELGDLFQLFENENNPPLHFILLHFWIKLFGSSVFSVRFLSVLFGALTVIPIYKIGKENFSKNVGIITALIFTFSNFHILEAHDTRVYTLLVLLVTISYQFFFRILRQRTTKKELVLYSLALVLMLYAHYIAGLVLLSQFAIVLFEKQNKLQKLKLIFLTQLVSVILFLPFISVFINRITSSAQNESWVPTPTVESLYWMLRDFFNQPVVAVMAICSLVGLIVIMVLKKKKLDTKNYFICYLWFLLPYLMLFLVSFYSSLFFGKYLLFASIGFYFIVALFWDNLIGEKKGRVLVGIVPVALMMATSEPNISNNRFPKKVVNIVKEYQTDATAIIICPAWDMLVFSYYYNREFFDDYKRTKERFIEDNVWFVYNADGIEQKLYQEASSIIFVDAGCDLQIIPQWEDEFDLYHQEVIHPHVITVWKQKTSSNR